MITNPVRKALIERKVTFGTWIQLPYAGIAEILANAGYEWIAADCEHADIDMKEFIELARGMHGRGAMPLVRVRENDTLAIRRMLDGGAEGVIVPLVNTAEQARTAVAAAKYPPLGIRGYCFSRMNNYGEDFDQYAKEANDNIAVVVMIESKKAVENIDKILAVDGVDGVLIGPYDMSGSYGIPGQTSHPDISAACKAVIDACCRAGKSAGLHIVKVSPKAIQEALDAGFTFIVLGADVVFLSEAAGNVLKTARSILEPQK